MRWHWEDDGASNLVLRKAPTYLVLQASAGEPAVRSRPLGHTGGPLLAPFVILLCVPHWLLLRRPAPR